MTHTRFSVVVTASPGAAGLAQTLESLRAQDYPALEVIQEPVSAGAAEAAVAAALDRGFALAAGEILGWLRPGEVLLPDTLRSVASEITPGGRCLVVLGRSCFMVEGFEAPAVERLSEYLGHFEHLAAWKRRFDAVSSNALFWHRDAAERAGLWPMAEAQDVAYELVCRLGEHHRIRPVDALWSASLLEPPAIPESELQARRLRASRRYWRSWLSATRWRCEASYAWHRLHLHDRARHHARRAEEAARQGRRAEAALERLRAWLASPAMARGRFGAGRRP